MTQYLELLEEIKEKGTWKDAARENMPKTLSLFGAQMRFDLSEGFPILTTKKLSFKNIVTELLWFLKGDTNIKYLVDNGCNIWNEDAYNYYLKRHKIKFSSNNIKPITFEDFIERIKNTSRPLTAFDDFELGDCGKQYGWLWRHWRIGETGLNDLDGRILYKAVEVDQIKELIDGLKKNPMSRRHILTAWNPATLDDMALNACHAFVQFNCRPLDELQKRSAWRKANKYTLEEYKSLKFEDINKVVPQYYLDCQMYQRSADVFLGVPFNIASYALLTEILAKICNMIPGDFIHTFGDIHIYENHMEQVEEQLKRTPDKLPKLHLADGYNIASIVMSWEDIINPEKTDLFKGAFVLENYNPQASIKAELSTGMKK